jgi:hypothetical protein
MEPIITLPYSEWLVAEQLMRALSARDGDSVYAPLSRQEKGVDLILARRTAGGSRMATLQVKYSRAYEQPPRRGFKFETLFHSFPVSEFADFFVLASLYPNITGRGDGKQLSSWLPLLLVFKRKEMAEFIASLRTRGGRVDRMFGFGFDSPKRVLHTRGAVEHRDVTRYTFEKRVTDLQAHFETIKPL